MATLTLPTPLRPYADGQKKIDLEGGHVGALLDALVSRFNPLQKHLFAEDGKLRSFVNVYVNDDDIRHLDGLETKVADSDVVSIIPSIAGGSTT